jgi:integrase/recombinase XerD
MEAPLITVFVRHSKSCPYVGDEFSKRCKCKKHLRWSQNGKQYRMKTGARSWAGAEEKKRELEAQLSGRVPEKSPEGLLLIQAIETFDANKQAQGVKPRVRAMYARELKRLLDFSESRGLLVVKQALTIDNLIALRATWMPVYKSSYSRAVVQKHLNHFLRFCYNAGWIDRIPKLSPIKIDEPETEPLTDAEYKKVLGAATGKTATIIKLMRWSGLAIRDASTLQRTDLHFDKEKDIYKIIRDRTKTGEPLYIPIPKDVAEEVAAVINGNPVYVFWNRQASDSSEYRHAGYMGEQIAAAFAAAGVQSSGHMISHRLRATFAVDLLQKGLPLEHVSKLLGHRSVTTTERHYAKWVKGRQDRLDALVSATWKDWRKA